MLKTEYSSEITLETILWLSAHGFDVVINDGKIRRIQRSEGGSNG